MMYNFFLKKSKSGKSGQALILVLVLLTIGSLLITGLLAFISTGSKTSTTYVKKSAELYAADAGIQDATWQIRSQNLNNTFPTYNRYTFGSPGWSYTIPPVNYQTTDVNIQNMWMIPTNALNPVPGTPTPRQVIEGQAGPPVVAPRLNVSGICDNTTQFALDGITKIYRYDVKIAYYPNAGESLCVSKIGLWLPPGFTYFTDGVSGTAHYSYVTVGANKYNLESLPVAPVNYSAYTAVFNSAVPWAGSNTAVWTFNAGSTFASFPGVSIGASPAQNTITISLWVKPPQDQPSLKPDAVAWVTTSGTGTVSLPYSWDASTSIIKTTSHAYTGTNTGTTIDSFMSHSELPQLQTAQAGDYVAAGTSLMLGVSPTSNQRELLLNDSSTNVSSIPSNAKVELAYLYWSGWLKQPLAGHDPAVGVFWDNGNNLNNWTAGSAWTSSGTSSIDFNGQLVGHYASGGDPAKYLTLNIPTALSANNSIDLTGVNTATIQWKQVAASTALTVAYLASDIPVAGTTGSVTPALPAGLSPNDVCVLVASTIAGGSMSMTGSGSISSWTQLTGSPVDVSGGEKLYVWWGRWSSGTTGPTLIAGSDHIIAGISAYHNISTDANPIEVQATGSSTSNTTSFSFNTGLTTTLNNQKVIVVCTSGYDSNTAQFSGAFTNGNLSSISTRLNTETSNGGGGGFGLADGTLATAGSVGTWAETMAQKSQKAYICFTIKPFLDTVRLSISNNGGTSYTEVGNYPVTGNYTYNIGSAYYNSQFKMRFYLDGFDQAGEYVDLDNIGVLVTSAAITNHTADTTVFFSINGGTPHLLAADPTNADQVQSQTKDAGADGFYYGCRLDVTQFVKNESNGVNLSASPDPIYGNGNGAYDVGGAYADSLQADGVTYGTASFTGWSLVIIYSSPDTLGHQLYLYDLKDTFTSVPASPANTVAMQIAGFIVPKQNTGETEVAKLTCFVGEGDIQITGDYVALVNQRGTSQKLWDGVDLPSDNNTQLNPNNVWNGRSTGSASSQAGIDVDTFSILWSDSLLQQGDTSATLNLYTSGDGYVTIYKILSFRSKITTGGSIGYLIRN